MVKRTALASLFLIGVSFAHHGTATLGGVGLEGPGVPIETSSSYTLPEGHWLFSLKLDYPKFRKYSFENFPDQKDYYQFWTLGIGYGFKPWLSGYLFVPYYIKKEIKSLDENDPSVGQYEYRNTGFADPLIAERGFRIDAVLEANFQYNQKDKEDGIKLEDSGGKILYGTFGGRLYYKNLSLAAGLKLPLWKDLNQHNQQQGAEGKEKYRLLMSLSFTF